ncbi:MAG: hypothetical protein ABRQ24_09880 [Syntrophomonadaceae bacterium]
MPMEVIVDRLFAGNWARANEQVLGLEKNKLIEFAGDYQVSLTDAGKRFLKQKRP